jgi:hypothetical protein
MERFFHKCTIASEPESVELSAPGVLGNLLLSNEHWLPRIQFSAGNFFK